MSLKEARDNLAKRLKTEVVNYWFYLLDSGYSITEAFTHTCQPKIAVYEPQACAEAAALFIEEMRLSGVDISCFVMDASSCDFDLCEKYGIQRITPDELSAHPDVNFVVLLSEGEEFSEQRFNLESRTRAEIVSLQTIVVLVNNKYFILKIMVRYLKESMTKICAVTWPYVHNFDNPSLYKNILKVMASYGEYQKDPERFERLYSDIAEFSLEYMQSVLSEYRTRDGDGFVSTVDCAGKYVNIVNGRRVTVGQPDSSEFGVYIHGGCTAHGFGTDDRYTMGSVLQGYINRHYGSRLDSICSVYNLGSLVSDIMPYLKFMRNDNKKNKILLYIMRGDISYSKKKNSRIYAYIEDFWREYGVDCIDLTPVLQDVEERLGTYIDSGHANHRGYTAAAGVLFDYVKPILESWDREVPEALSGDNSSLNVRLSPSAKHKRLTDSGHSVSELFVSEENTPDTSIYCSESSLDTAVSLAEELIAQSLNVKYLIVPALNAQAHQVSCGIELVSIDELASAEKTDVIITMPDVFDDDREKIRAATKAEVISFNDLVKLVYDRCFYYPELLSALKERGAHICLVQWLDADSVGAACGTRGLANITANIGWYGANLYSDIPGFSLPYLEEISATEQTETLSGEAKHTDCKGKFLNISGGDRATPSQPKVFDRTVFVYGGGVAFGVGGEDKYTIPALLQEQLNELHSKKPDTPVCRVVNKGLRLMGASDEYILKNKILPNFDSGAVKEGDIVIWITEKRYSITERDKTAYEYLNRTLMEYGVSVLDLTQTMRLAEKKGAYIDDRHVNHRGYRAAATKIYFDYVKNLL